MRIKKHGNLKKMMLFLVTFVFLINVSVVPSLAVETYDPKSGCFFDVRVYADGVERAVITKVPDVPTVTVPEKVENVGSWVCVYEIGVNAFAGCNYVKRVKLPSGITYIDPFAFYDCIALESINIPDGVTRIGSSAFKCCGSLTNITIPDGVISIEDSVFWGCAFTSITIPSSVTTINASAFLGCSDLANITIPSSVLSIGHWAFSGCYSLTDITFLSPTTTIYDAADTVSDTATIHGYTGSTAEAYAKKYGRTFVSLGAPPCAHKNAAAKAEIPSTCKEQGYAAGTYCPDCETYTSGGERLPLNTTHTYGVWTNIGT